MAQKRWHPLAPLTGVLFVILIVASFIIGGETPDTNDSPQEIVDFYKDKEDRQFFAAALLGWTTIPFMFFVGILRSVLRGAGDAGERIGTVAFGGGLLMAAGMLSFAGFTFTLADGVDDLGPEAFQTLNALNSDFFFLLAGGGGVLLIATAVGTIRSRVLPPWLGWVALVLGIAAVTPAGFFAFLLFLVWTLIVSIVIWRKPAAGQPGQTGLAGGAGESVGAGGLGGDGGGLGGV